MCRNKKQSTTGKVETWSRGTNSRQPFDVNVKLNLSIYNLQSSFTIKMHDHWLK